MRACGGIILLAVALAGCAVAPVTEAERRDRAAADGERVAAVQPAPTAPIGLYQAMARALVGNLDRRVKVMEQAVAEGIADATTYELLPQTVASRGWSRRSNDNASTSRTLGTDTLQEASTSEDRSHVASQLAVTWNVLDFGISWLKARQNLNRVLIAQEQRRKAMHSLLQDVRAAWGKAVAAERLAADIDPLIARIRAAVASARDIEAQRLRPPAQALDTQKQLLETLRQLLALRREMGAARIELANLMGLPPGTPFTLAMPAFDRPPAAAPAALAALEERALLDRPELREQDYQVRISADEVRKAVLRLLPGIEIGASANQDTNSYLTHHSWMEAGLKVSWNLVSLPSAPANIAAATRQEELARVRRLSLHLAVLTQVNLAWQRVAMAREEYDLGRQLVEVDERLYRHAQAGLQSSAQNELELARAEAVRAVSRLRRDLAYVETQVAASALRVSVGDEPDLPPTEDIAELTLALGRHYQSWDAPQEAPARVDWTVVP